ncbi:MULTISPECIES: hypothetical protein [Streptomyces]|uniref:Uncharacterized protein n=1 Tax=Streptomyces fimbriatus TaxID=68197 RepID=A0ABW0D7D8_STRFI
MTDTDGNRVRKYVSRLPEGAPKAARAILRHSRISMTTGVCTHVVGDSEREAVGMPAELLEDPLIG